MAGRHVDDREEAAPAEPAPQAGPLRYRGLVDRYTLVDYALSNEDTVVFETETDTIVLDAVTERLDRSAGPPAPAKVPGRKPAVTERPRRNRWEWDIKYPLTLILVDALVTLGAGAAAFFARFGQNVTPHNRNYLVLTALLPLAFVASLGVTRAYERRFLFVGTDEYQRVIRAGIGLTATSALVAYAFEIRLARGYMVIA
ncbi:MAG TPA: hypothetical protein VFM55_07085, partial [Micromonosporaceae bacterium]|nr:hypothetical protein [Micromonosporaceae bacterium]